MGGTRKDFCLSCVNRRALSQSLRIMSITIFYFFWGHRNLTQSTPRSPRETERGTTDYTDVEKTTRNPKKCCPSNQTNGAKQLGCQTYYRPPALSVISVSSVVISYTPEFPAAPGGADV